MGWTASGERYKNMFMLSTEPSDEARRSRAGPVDHLLAALRAAAEPTRLRIIGLCARGELTVGELARILGQSQPRVSRHVKVLAEAGLVERLREGSWLFLRLVRDGAGAELAHGLLALLPDDDGLLALDRRRLAAVKEDRARAAAAYFRRNARDWSDLRSLHVDEAEVERTLIQVLPVTAAEDLLDVGTGTARMLELFGPRVRRAEGIDISSEMLAVARANLEREALANCSVRKGDMYRLPHADASFDAVIVHQVLHFADEPARAIAEAGRVLRMGGRLAVVDFAPHALEYLRAEHQHRRLGFADAEVLGWFRASRLKLGAVRHLAGNPLTVTLWLALKPPSGRHAATEPEHHDG